MQTKTNMLVFSLATILALSAVSIITVDEVEAAWESWEFMKKPDFTADFMIVDDTAAPDGAAATAKFWLDLGSMVLKYRISIENMDISGFGDTSDDVTKLHFHEGTNSMHVLNVYKSPGQDDNDLIVKPTKGLIGGMWDDDDENHTYDDHHSYSETLTSQLENLCNGNLYVMIHGANEVGVLMGTIVPTDQGILACGD